MTLAVMQPYLFPYIGYYQLLQAADKFVFYDDVTFIKQGWINRNRILTNGKPSYFTVPLQQVSSFTAIKDTLIDERQIARWKKKFKASLSQNYAKSPYKKDVLPLLENFLTKDFSNIGDMAKESVLLFKDYFNIKVEIGRSSSIYKNDELSAQNRVLDICKIEGAKAYVNPINGQSLYDKERFKQLSMDLYFIETKVVKYEQIGKGVFQPYLSIIDVAMNNSVEEVNDYLTAYHLI